MLDFKLKFYVKIVKIVRINNYYQVIIPLDFVPSFDCMKYMFDKIIRQSNYKG